MSASDRLDARYGRRTDTPRRRRVRLVAGVSAGLLLLVGLATVLYAWSTSRQDVTGTVTGYKPLSPTRTTVSITVDKGKHHTVSCRVVAEDQYTDIVGSVDLTISGAATRVARTVSVQTRGLAVTALVQSCRAVG